MLFQVGGQGTRPTFFEMAAAQQLPASLRGALTYSFGVSSYWWTFAAYWSFLIELCESLGGFVPQFGVLFAFNWVTL